MMTPHTRQFVFALDSDTTSIFDNEVLHVNDITRCRTRCFQGIQDVLVRDLHLGIKAVDDFVGLTIEADLSGKSNEF